jgi:hypothetical protein
MLSFISITGGIMPLIIAVFNDNDMPIDVDD